MVGLPVSVLKQGHVPAHLTVGTHATYIPEWSLWGIDHCYSCPGISVIFRINMHPHNKFLSQFIEKNFRAFNDFAGMEIMRRIIPYRGQCHTFIFPMDQIPGRITAHSPSMCAVSFPVAIYFRQPGFTTFDFAIPVIATSMLEDTPSMGINGLAIRIKPHLSGFEKGLFVITLG